MTTEELSCRLFSIRHNLTLTCVNSDDSICTIDFSEAKEQSLHDAHMLLDYILYYNDVILCIADNGDGTEDDIPIFAVFGFLYSEADNEWISISKDILMNNMLPKFCKAVGDNPRNLIFTTIENLQ